MYTCKKSFTAENGNYYMNGKHCTSLEYEDLTYDEQMNFFHDEDLSSERKSDIVEDIIDTEIALGFGSMLSDDDPSTDFGSSSDSGSDFGGMGGGDFGGGGASSDW